MSCSEIYKCCIYFLYLGIVMDKGHVSQTAGSCGTADEDSKGMEDNKEKEGGLAPMAEEGIHAGFPSPAQDYMSRCIDLNKELVRHPAATFYGRVVGDSMVDAGVEEGDILVIDRSLEACEGDMAVCFVDGEFALKYISFHTPEGHAGSGKCLWLLPANSAYPPIKVDESSSFTVWGVVTYVIKKVNRR